VAAIDYYDIAEAISAVLLADSAFAALNAKAFIEEDFAHGMSDIGLAAMIYADRRAPHPQQPLAAGQQTRFVIKYSLWARAFALESMKAAVNKRDQFLGVIETALMRKRTLNHAGTDIVSMLWLEGGEMMTGKMPKANGFIASAETIVVVEKTSSTS
jgi:hypothetical protein